jgi:hypothetical protein
MQFVILSQPADRQAKRMLPVFFFCELPGFFAPVEVRPSLRMTIRFFVILSKPADR